MDRLLQLSLTFRYRAAIYFRRVNRYYRIQAFPTTCQPSGMRTGVLSTSKQVKIPAAILLNANFRIGQAVVLGEWGGQMTAPDSTWLTAFVTYLQSRSLTSQFFWCLNPDSGDTGTISFHSNSYLTVAAQEACWITIGSPPFNRSWTCSKS